MVSTLSGFSDNTMSPERELVAKLLQRNHQEHALLLHKVLHNHLPHLLGSVYFLHGGGSKLETAYAHESIDLESWASSSPFGIANDPGLYEHLGDISYQQSFVDYFNSKLVQFDGNWEAMITQYLLLGAQPLINGLVGGFGHPLILLADAFELESSVLAVEALALNAIDFNDLHKFLLLPVKGATPEPTLSPQEILTKISQDQRFNGLIAEPGVQNTTKVLSKLEPRTAVIEYLLMLSTSNIPDLISELADLAVLLQSTTHKPGEPAYDFYLNHILTFVYCLKVLLPVFPEAENSLILVRGVWLLTILAYITQMRPAITPFLVEDVMIEDDASWEDVFREFHGSETLEGKYLDAHFLRAMRNLMEIGKTRGGKEVFYLKAAEKLRIQWTRWTGFGMEGEVKLNV